MTTDPGAAIDKAHADFDRAFADGRYRDADRHLRLAAELLARIEVVQLVHGGGDA